MKSKVSAFVQATWMCCCLQLDLVAQPTVYPSYFRFQHYGLSDGLPEEHASGVIQDSLGFLWIRGAAGISRYDGYDFKNYMDTECEGPRYSSIWDPRFQLTGWQNFDTQLFFMDGCYEQLNVGYVGVYRTILFYNYIGMAFAVS